MELRQLVSGYPIISTDTGPRVDDAFIRRLLTNGQFKRLPFNSALPVMSPANLVVYAHLPSGWGQLSPDKLQEAMRTRGPKSTTTMFRSIFQNLLDPQEYELLKTQLMTEEDKQERVNDMFAEALEGSDGAFNALFHDHGVTGLFKKANQPSYAIVVKLPRGMEARDVFRPVTVPPDDPPAFTIPRQAVLEAMSRTLPDEEEDTDEKEDETFAFERNDPERSSLREQLSMPQPKPEQSLWTNQNPDIIQLITDEFVQPSTGNQTFDALQPEKSAQRSQLSERSSQRNPVLNLMQSERSAQRSPVLNLMQSERSDGSQRSERSSQRSPVLNLMQSERSAGSQRPERSSQRSQVLGLMQAEPRSQLSERSSQRSQFSDIEPEQSTQSQRSQRSQMSDIEPDQSSQRTASVFLPDGNDSEQPTQYPPIRTADLSLVDGLETEQDLANALSEELS